MRREMPGEMLEKSHVNIFAVVMGTYPNSSCRILGKQDALELDNEEIDELLNVIEERLQSLLWNSVVSARTERCRYAGSHDEFAHNLSKRGD
jgi:hypothetical protein